MPLRQGPNEGQGGRHRALLGAISKDAGNLVLMECGHCPVHQLFAHTEASRQDDRIIRLAAFSVYVELAKEKFRNERVELSVRYIKKI